MAKSTRNIGQEILDGLRELKRGEHGRVTTLPSVAAIREKDGPVAAGLCASARCVSPNAAGMGTGPASADWSCADAAAHRREEPQGALGRCLNSRD